MKKTKEQQEKDLQRIAELRRNVFEDNVNLAEREVFDEVCKLLPEENRITYDEYQKQVKEL